MKQKYTLIESRQLIGLLVAYTRHIFTRYKAIVLMIVSNWYYPLATWGNWICFNIQEQSYQYTVYPKKYAHGFVVLCFVVVMQSFIMNSHEVFIHIHQDCFAGTGAIVRLPQCQWSKPDGYGKISQCITTTKHSKAKTVCIFLGIYCRRYNHEDEGIARSSYLHNANLYTDKTPSV